MASERVRARYEAALAAEREDAVRAGRDDRVEQVDRHLADHYSKLETTAADSPPEDAAEPQVNDAPTVCGECGDEFSSPRGVAIHKAKAHEG